MAVPDPVDPCSAGSLQRRQYARGCLQKEMLKREAGHCQVCCVLLPGDKCVQGKSVGCLATPLTQDEKTTMQTCSA